MTFNVKLYKMLHTLKERCDVEFTDLTKLFTEYGNKWVALTDDKQVIASANTLNQVLVIAHKKDYDNPLTARLPDPNTEYVL